MRVKEASLVVAATSPAAASTTAVGGTFKGANLTRGSLFVIDAALFGGTGGTLDVYLQRKVATDTWRDWIHFPQLAAATAKKYTVTVTGEGTSIVEVGAGTDSTPAVAITANTVVNVLPGGDVRVVFVSGTGVSVGALNTVTITPYVDMA